LASLRLGGEKSHVSARPPPQWIIVPSRLIIDRLTACGRRPGLSAQQKEWVWKAIDFNALPANVDPLRDGMR
jgi:hypothetical protein